MKRSATFWLLPAAGLCAVLAVGAGMWKSASPPAPKDRGVCWQMEGEGTGVIFRRLAADVANFESCAVRLEVIYLREKRELTGAYQGRFIFVGAASIQSAPHLEGARWPIFFGPQRAQIDDLIRKGTGVPTIRLAPEP